MSPYPGASMGDAWTSLITKILPLPTGSELVIRLRQGIFDICAAKTATDSSDFDADENLAWMGDGTKRRAQAGVRDGRVFDRGPRDR